jgi:diadenylate cyclase
VNLGFIFSILKNFTLYDLLDIGVLAFIVYRFLLIIQGTRAVQMLVGLFALTSLYWISLSYELYSLNWLLNKFFDYFFVVLIILFQEEIRAALVSFGETKFFSRKRKTFHDEDIEEVITVCSAFQREKIGALIVFERNHGLLNFALTGTRINSRVHSDIIYSIFQSSSPLHDGAVIVYDGKIQAAGCFLPLSKNVQIDRHYGTRHRAALGVSEVSDAIVVIVSEETGNISLCVNGEFILVSSELELREKLLGYFESDDLNYSSQKLRKIHG